MIASPTNRDVRRFLRLGTRFARKGLIGSLPGVVSGKQPRERSGNCFSDAIKSPRSNNGC